mmetsp:Transcript_81780/g.227743  ORF Transcript_81780/g.227743 Transcript_81780/m.227743 type:complete len:271 (+) Transcript_81780:151-963(+)
MPRRFPGGRRALISPSPARGRNGARRWGAAFFLNYRSDAPEVLPGAAAVHRQALPCRVAPLCLGRTCDISAPTRLRKRETHECRARARHQRGVLFYSEQEASSACSKRASSVAGGGRRRRTTAAATRAAAAEAPAKAAARPEPAASIAEVASNFRLKRKAWSLARFGSEQFARRSSHPPQTSHWEMTRTCAAAQGATSSAVPWRTCVAAHWIRSLHEEVSPLYQHIASHPKEVVVFVVVVTVVTVVVVAVVVVAVVVVVDGHPRWWCSQQ